MFPLLKWAISAFNAWVSTKEETQILELSKEGNVPAVRFIKALQESKEKIKELSEIIKSESKYIQDNENLLVEKSKIEAEKKVIEKKVVDLRVDLEERGNNIGWLHIISHPKWMDGWIMVNGG